MAGMLELSDRKFKTTLVNIQRALIDKVDRHAKTDGQCKHRAGNATKESKRNVTDEKHYSRNEECL